MSLRNFISKASSRGEEIKSQLLEKVVGSKLFNQLLQNENFLNAVAKVVNTKEGVEKAVQKNIHCLFRYFEVPTHQDLEGVERKLQTLENELETLHRQMASQGLKKRPKRNIN